MSHSNTNGDEKLRKHHAKLNDFANNIYLLLFQRLTTLIGAPLIIYFVMDISSTFKEMSISITDLRIEVARITEAVQYNKETIKDHKEDHNGR